MNTIFNIHVREYIKLKKVVKGINTTENTSFQQLCFRYNKVYKNLNEALLESYDEGGELIMISSKENYKKWHPDQFSDSVIIKKANLGRDFLEYYLSKISSRSQEKDFERFCKAILEVEICPNLIPQTGPTGGGDSKVDTETYPVSEQISESWLYGYGNKSSSERWAFAISSKAEWRSKIKSDVEKIVGTIDNGRNYTKIFFISNQQIADKKRADMEDDLRNKYGIDIRILSMDWLLDSVFKNDANKLIAVKTLGLSENLVDEKHIGERDYGRQQKLDEIESTLRNTSERKASEIIKNARKSVILSRELEKDEQETFARIDRYNRFAKEYGTIIDQADAIYESAHTIFWWYPSIDRFYDYYQKFETIASDIKSTYLFEKLCILWMNLFSLTRSEQERVIDLDQHRIIIESIFEFLVNDENKPNTILSARTSLQLIRLARGDSVDDVVNDYIDIVKKSENSLEVDVTTIAKIVQNLSIYQEAKNYDQLFDLIVARLSKEKKESEAAMMNTNRGSQLIDSDPYKALLFFSKAVLSFHNEANTDLLIRTVFLMGQLYEKLGLHWAARNYYFYVVTYCLNEYMKKGKVSPFLALAANELKFIELMQGRVIFSCEMHVIELIAREIYPGTIPEDINYFDALLAYPIFKTPFKKLHHLGKLPKYLDQKGLSLSATACRYELGYYSKDFLEAYNGSIEDADSYMKMWANQPAWDQIRYEPWYGFEEESILESKMMGCTFRVRSSKEIFAIEFAVTLLATLECMLGTGFHNDLFSRASLFEIEIIKCSQEGFSIEIEYNRETPTHMTIVISEYKDSEFQSAHKILSSKLIEVVSIIISTMLISNKDFQKLKEMVENEYILARTEIFTDSLFYGYSTFGPEAFSFDNLLCEYDEEPLIRSEKAMLHEDCTSSVDEVIGEKNIIYGTPPDFSHHQYKNDEIFMTDVINIPLWDISNWYGAAYQFQPSYLPVLSLVFKNESGIKIFDEWIKRYGSDDVENTIGIRIIKGIDSEHPYWYRIGIGENSFFSQFKTQKNCVVITPCRMHTMQPNNNIYLELFEQIQSNSGDFIIYPSIVRGPNEPPEEHREKQILKHAESIKILNAYEVEKNDMLAIESIMPTDKPIIPPGYEKCEVIEILNHKKGSNAS